jgi:hypothetical protein
MYFSLAQRKVPKETLPGSLACGFPRADAFFGAGRNSLDHQSQSLSSGSIPSTFLLSIPNFSTLRQSARFHRKNRPRSAALQRAGASDRGKRVL